MQQPQKRLGRGLSSLISVPGPERANAQASAGPLAEPPPESAFPSQLPVEQLRPNPFQPRRDIPPDQLKGLAESIRKAGVLQPIAVRKLQPEVFEIIAGERRWRAAQLAGLSTIPVIVREADDQQMLEMALVENIYREDLNAIDRALAYKRYCDEFGLSADAVAQRLGEDRATVTNYLRLLDLPADVRQLVAQGDLGMGHARALLGLKSASDSVSMARRVVDEGLSVRMVEKLVRDRLTARATALRDPAEGEAKRMQIRNLEQAFTRALGTKVEIQEAARRGRGRIVLHFFSLDDFDRIMERLGIESP